jgi:cytochrome c peroxidase
VFAGHRSEPSRKSYFLVRVDFVMGATGSRQSPAMARVWRWLAVALATGAALLGCSDAHSDTHAAGTGGAPATGGVRALTSGGSSATGGTPQAASGGRNATSGGRNEPSGGRSGASSGGDEWEILRELAPASLPPPPPDVSNRYADDAAAAAFGEKLFLDPGYSGKMLDLDNDGSSRSLGVRGQSGKVACSGCHDPDNGFLDNRSPFKEITLGTGWTTRHTPSLLDVGQASIVMWGGRHTTLHTQVFGALENPLEMNSSRLFFAQWIAENYAEEYEALFGAGALAALADIRRFPPLTPETTGCSLTQSVDHPRALPPDPLYDCHGFPGDGAEYDGLSPDDQERVTRIVVNAGKAIGAYERLLTCGPSRFDAWVQGDEGALTASEQNGARLFVGKAGCVSCHSGPYFSDQKFHALGLEEKATRSRILNDQDRGAAADLVKGAADPLGINGVYSDGNDDRLPPDVRITAEHEGAFRTPGLRCVGKRPSFMHSGLLLTLEAVVAFFNRGGDAPGTYPGTTVLEPLGLSDAEQADLVAFLRALDGSAPVPTFR